MTDVISTIFSLPSWVWIIIGVGVAIAVFADPITALSGLIKKFMETHTFKSADRTVSGYLRTRIGKRVIIGAFFLLLTPIGFFLWKHSAAPTMEAMAHNMETNRQNTLFENAYASIPLEEKCVTEGAPYTHENALHVTITANRTNVGNNACFYVRTKPLEARFYTSDHMQFEACQNSQGQWQLTKKTFLLGDFADDDDYYASAMRIVEYIRSSCTAESTLLAQQVPANISTEDQEESGWLKKLASKIPSFKD